MLLFAELCELYVTGIGLYDNKSSDKTETMSYTIKKWIR